MTDEPNKENENPEGTADEGSDAASAGPVAEDGPPANSPEDASSTPPADEAEESPEGQSAEEQAPEAEETPAAEGSDAEEAPAAEGSDAEEAPADEKPAEKEKKKDVIPGADLEPIAVEQDERPLSAEEQARKEAEEEERARKEAALTGEAEEETSAASRAPAKLDTDARFLATGKRKRSVARVTLLPGSGKIEINKRTLEEFFPRPLHQTIARQPLVTTGYEGNVDVRIRVHGGGVSGQAGAVRHGIARALMEIDPALRAELKRRGFLTRDARVKERRKAGLKKARKKPQFSKR